LAELEINDKAIQSYEEYIKQENPRAHHWIDLAHQKIKDLKKEI